MKAKTKKVKKTKTKKVRKKVKKTKRKFARVAPNLPVRLARITLGLNQRLVASRVHARCRSIPFSQETLSLVESGWIPPLRLRRAIAAVLNAEPDALFSLDD